MIFMEEGPSGPHKKEHLLEFCIGSLSEACSFFLRSAQNDLNMNLQMHKQIVLKLEEKITELKGELNTIKSTFETKQRQFESEKAHYEAREISLKENIDQLKQDKEKTENDLKTRLAAEKKEAQSLVEEYKQIAYNAEENSKAL